MPSAILLKFIVLILVIAIFIGLNNARAILPDDEKVDLMAYLTPRRNLFAVTSIKRSFEDPWSSIVNGKLFQDADVSRAGMNYKGLRG